MMSSAIDFLWRAKMVAVALLRRHSVSREAAQAFRYDKVQFIANIGTLQLDRKAAARAEIIMDYHILEKGLTMPRRHLGFGKDVIVRLINIVESFERRFGTDDSQVRHAVGVLRAYREMHRDWPEPMPRLDAFLAAHPDIPAVNEPHISKSDFFAAKDAPFPQFAASRHVVRHFAGPVPRETIESAIALATTAPSACNRQHAHVHVFDSAEMRDKLFEMQGGSRGFGSDADKVLVVTADLFAVHWSGERHDVYTNGGMFAMNLCYALHYFGVAHCILHRSVSPKTDREAHAFLGIPPNEAIVLIIACGMPPEEFDVAASPCMPLGEIMTWHGDGK